MNRYMNLISGEMPPYTIYDLFNNLELEDTALPHNSANLFIRDCMFFEGQLLIKYEHKVKGSENEFWETAAGDSDWYLAYHILATTHKIVHEQIS